MKWYFAAFLTGYLSLAGCGSQPTPAPSATDQMTAPETLAQLPSESPAPPAPNPGQSPSPSSSRAPAVNLVADEEIANIRGESIGNKEFEDVLIQTVGFEVLENIAMRDIARQEAAKLGLSVTPQDIADEKDIDLAILKAKVEENSNGPATTRPVQDDLTKEQLNQMLDRALAQDHTSQAEFQIILETSALMRKIARPRVQAAITEDAVREDFDIIYGEKLHVHYIVCDNMAEAAEIKRLLADPKKNFDEVAAKARGGNLEAFSLKSNLIPLEIKQLASTLKVGEVSDALQYRDHIYILKMIERIPPEHAKFEDYHDAVRHDLEEKGIAATITVLRQAYGDEAKRSLVVRQPFLARQWQEKLDSANGPVRSSEQIKQDMDRTRAAATQPAGAAALKEPAAATQPAAANNGP